MSLGYDAPQALKVYAFLLRGRVAFNVSEGLQVFLFCNVSGLSCNRIEC